MKRSETRILTTHVGSLPRPKDLIELYQQDAPDSTLLPRLKSAVTEIVSQQVAAGIDIVDDGEFGKAMRRSVDYTVHGGLTFTIASADTRLARRRRRGDARGGHSGAGSVPSSRSSMPKTAGWGAPGRQVAAVRPDCSASCAPAPSSTLATPAFAAISIT